MKKSIGPKDMVFPCPAFLVATYDETGEPDVMTAAWGGIVCSDPIAIGVAIRPQRKTFKNLKVKKAFTISIPGEEHMMETDYFGLVSGEKENKFEVSGLTPEKAEFVDAPYVKEIPYNIECEVIEELDLGAHTLFIGAVKDIKVDDDCLNEDGNPDWDKIKPFIFDRAKAAYRRSGEIIANAYSIGQKLSK